MDVDVDVDVDPECRSSRTAGSVGGTLETRTGTRTGGDCECAEGNAA